MFDLMDKAIIRKLSGDIPLTSEPYKIIAEELGISEQELLNKVRELHDKGVIKRIGGIIHHRKSGYEANAMVVWVIPEDIIDEVGKVLSSFSEITHCYQRPTFQGWPYNLFTMVHSESRQQCEDRIRKMSEIINVYNYKILYSTKELKKSSMEYFI